MKRKLQILHEILACSQRQADFLLSGEELDIDGLEAITTIKQGLIDTLGEIESNVKPDQIAGDGAAERLAEETGQILRQITELDTQNIKILESRMGEVRGEIKENKEKIKVNKAYQPILGREKNVSRRIDVKDV